MAQESGGQVNVQNPVHSARGLFQLTAANYHLNPNGAGSFGNAVEEAMPAQQITRIWPGDVVRVKAATFWEALNLF